MKIILDITYLHSLFKVLSKQLLLYDISNNYNAQKIKQFGNIFCTYAF